MNVLDTGKVFVPVQDSIFIFHGEIDRKYKMDVLLIAGVDTAAGNPYGKKLVTVQLQLFNQERFQRIIRVFQRDIQISQSQHVVSSSCQRNWAGSVKAFSG